MAIIAVGLTDPVLQFDDASGVPYAGGTVVFNAAGTTNAQNVYSDAALTTPLTNPVHLNAAGRSSTSAIGSDTPVYLLPLPYDITLKDLNGVTVYGPISVAGSNWPSAVIGTTTLAPAANANGYANRFTTTLNKASSGTHALFAGTRFDIPTIGAGASTLTEAATVYIEGPPASGTTPYALDVAAGAVHFGGDVTTTGWTDYSATSTIVGWSSFTTKKIFYKQIGKIIYVQFVLIGTSNSINTTFTLPVAMQTDLALDISLGFGKDNGTALTNPGLIEILTASASTVTIYTSQAAGAWTNSGTKSAVGQFWYQTA